MTIRCSICGCENYTKRGNTCDASGCFWLFECSNGHRWSIHDEQFSINHDFPWREDDYYHPKNYAWDVCGNWRRVDDENGRFVFAKNYLTEYQRKIYAEAKRRAQAKQDQSKC